MLTGIGLHGAQIAAWFMPRPSAQATVNAVLARWRQIGLPTYVQFDNDTSFQEARQWPDSVGRLTRVCLALEVTPVFAPPREPGFQNAIEGFNALWQAKVWRRDRARNAADLQGRSDRYVAAPAPRPRGGPRPRPPTPAGPTRHRPECAAARHRDLPASRR